MKSENVISKELLSHLVMLEEEHQNKVLSYIKKLLGEEGILNDEEKMNLHSLASERDIDNGRVKKAVTFKREFEQWQKKKRDGAKL